MGSAANLHWTLLLTFTASAILPVVGQILESLLRNDGVVVSYCPVASAIGKRVLIDGGNAVDAAVAVAFALAVTYPQAGNLGGGGFMLIHLDRGETHCLDYRETAPRHACLADYVDPAASVVGARAVGVPGTVAGLAAALARFGRMSWDRILAPCIALAKTGTWVTTRQGAAYQVYAAELERFPSTRAALFVDGAVPKPGTLLAHPELGRTLRELADDGPAAFYRGRIAQRIDDEVRRGGGRLDLEDLSAYRCRWREPVRTELRDTLLWTPPLPSTGGFLLRQILAFIESQGGEQLSLDAPDYAVLVARSCRAAYGLRRDVGTDPDHAGTDRAPAVRTDLDETERELARASHPTARQLPPAGAERSTTHFCVLDRDGNAVSNTYSLNTLFGAKLAVSGAGFLLNNSMDDFFLGPGHANWYSLVDGPANELRPNRRPVSSMTPVVVTTAGRARLLIGGSGGPRIPTMLAQTTLAASRLRLREAIARPRIHHQLTPDAVWAEPDVPEAWLAALARAGFRIEQRQALGVAAGISWLPEPDEVAICLDPRFGAVG